MEQEKVCYQFLCRRYPECARARGKGCCIEPNPEETEVREGECTKENGYPLFQKGKIPAGIGRRRTER